MTGITVGLDLREAMLSLPEWCDRGFARRLLVQAYPLRRDDRRVELVSAESAYLDALIAAREAREGKPDGE